jgi:gamma-glutamylcyclotransferase (GGCT)/AIG2-like uncharacterized protein YtfP
MSELLFVYGTLRKGYPHSMARELERRGRWIGQGTASGVLVVVAHYPGLIDSSHPDDRVVGDIFEVDGSLLAELDEYEECAPASPLPHPYVRERRPVQLGEDTLTAWTYRFVLDPAGKEIIASGDFMNSY